VRLAHAGDELVVEVRDDGVGGARASTGSGLSGLADRLGACDGILEVDSPPGEGTLVRAVLPVTNGAGAPDRAGEHIESHS
jgi:signal transduction histidine kinase